MVISHLILESDVSNLTAKAKMAGSSLWRVRNKLRISDLIYFSAYVRTLHKSSPPPLTSSEEKSSFLRECGM